MIIPAPLCRLTVLLTAFFAIITGHLAGASSLKPGDRIVFIGDSITGQGGNSPQGWVHLIDEALRAARPGNTYSLVALGGSGQGVTTWMHVEKKSRTETFALDVKANDVKTNLDQPADVVISMLGMNDVLFPRVADTPESAERWAADYTKLIQTLRERVTPRVFAVATPTLCTEDDASPKNRVMRDLIAQLTTLAVNENCVVLPTHETMREFLDQGRRASPEFHVTSDFVHPNNAGHVAIAVGMLRGLGETAAAEWLQKKYAPHIFKPRPLSWRIDRLNTESRTLGAPESFRIRYYRNAPRSSASSVTLDVPAGWRVVSRQHPDAAGGEFVVEGVPATLITKFQLTADGQKAALSIPAPWLIGTTNIGRTGWEGDKFNPSLKPIPQDEAFSKGEGFGQPTELAPGRALVWSHYIGSIDYGGGNTPGAVDMAGVSFFQNFDVAYGVRWIRSTAERPVGVRIRRLGFVSPSHLTVWLNGKDVYTGQLSAAPSAAIPVTLNPGWNALVFKSNNWQVQWQFAIDLVGEDLDSLQASAIPPDRLK
jgi:lysophospholipase L1-like esterase